MADNRRNTLMRPDTFFGICEAVGQDFGFNPLWLRLALVPPIFFQPLYSLIAYLTLGLVVLASRLLFPPKVAASQDVAPATPEAAPMPAPVRIHEVERLPLAA